MDKVDTNQNRFLNVEYIQEKLDEGYNYTEDAKGRDLVLVIGITGVGKSTTCNYLLNRRMRAATYCGRPVIETIDDTDIKIGHEVKAETLYAKTVLVESNASLQSGSDSSCICLLDCPGFLGNRTVEDRVIESISTELAIRNARQIKGILIHISLYALLETRLTELRELVKTLISLFKDPVEMVQYSIFVITKKNKHMPDDEARDITIGTLSSLKDYCEKQAKFLYENRNLNSAEGFTYIDYDRIATYFSVVLTRPENILLINPLDNGESRNLIFNHINKIIPRRGYFKEGINYIKNAVGISANKHQNIWPITIDDFRFSEYDENRVKFNRTVHDRARDGYLLIRNIQDYRELNLNLFSEIKNCETMLSMLKQLHTNLVKEVHMAEEDKSRIKEINNEIVELSKKQENIKMKISDLKCNSQTLRSTIELATNSKEAYKNSLEQTLRECDKDIQHHNNRIVKMQQDREEAINAGLTSLQEFDNNRRKFDIIVSIAAVLEFPSSLIKCFISQYNEFLSDIDTYRHIFGESNSDLLPYMKKSEKEGVWKTQSYVIKLKTCNDLLQ